MRLVLVHGFSQTPQSWKAVTSLLPLHVEDEGVVEDVQTLTPDIPDDLSFEETAGHIAAHSGNAIYVGYSLGGRLCLRAALDHPQVVRGLVLISATAGIQDAAQRSLRAERDRALVDDIARLGVEAFLRRWMSQPLFATLTPDPEELVARVGAYSPSRLAGQLIRLGQGAQAPLWDRLGELGVPVFVVTGLDDAKYDELGDEVGRRVNGSTRMKLHGGHSLLLERPHEVAAVIALTILHVLRHERAQVARGVGSKPSGPLQSRGSTR